MPGWETRFPWLRAGTTQRGEGGGGFNLGGRWHSVIRSRQVHGSVTQVHTDVPRGASVAGDGDGHATRVAGVLLTVTLADCVPVFIADPVAKAVALLHAGWRGTAAGVVESGIGVLGDAFGSAPAPIDLRRVIRNQAKALGVDGGHLSVSDECTLCGDGRYFSHRRGDTGRHRAYIGILPRDGRGG